MNAPDEKGTKQRPESGERWRRLLLLGASGVIVIAGAVVAFNLSGPLSPQVCEHLGGVAKARIIVSARTVKVWRPLGSFRHEETMTGENFGELYQKAGSPAVVPSKLATRLRRILLDPGSYIDFDPPREKTSVTMPCVVLNFANSKADVDVFISFADDVLQVKKDKPVRPGSRAMAHGDFDPVRKELIEIVKQVLPADQQIESLTDTNWGGTLWPEATRWGP